MSVHFKPYLYLITVVFVGFLRSTYTVQEVEGTVTVQFGILEGTLERDLFVKFNYTSGTAVGKLFQDPENICIVHIYRMRQIYQRHIVRQQDYM